LLESKIRRMKQFRIEVASNGQGYTFDITDLGNQQFEIYKGEDRFGTIQIDGKEHEHCQLLDCEIDLPLLNAIRQGILLHQELTDI
jgi:hypothetical protein